MLRMQNGISVLHAAAIATQAALNNPALQPILMAGPNPWLNPIYQSMGLVNPTTASPAATAAALATANSLAQVPGSSSAQMLDASSLSATSQYGGHLQQGQLRKSSEANGRYSGNPALFSCMQLTCHAAS